MQENQSNINNKKQFQLITDKRAALEVLINIASGIYQQQAALNDLSIVARPSQDFSKKTADYFRDIKKALAEESVPEVISKLDKIEKSIDHSLSRILKLSSIDINLLRQKQVDNLDVDGFTKAINHFKKKTQNSMALRYVLQQRGVVIAPFKLPIPQEGIHEQIEELKQKENQCVIQIKEEINIIIEDTAVLLRQTEYSDEMKAEIANVNQAMQVNLHHLEQGGSVIDIPNVFEIITLESPKCAESNELNNLESQQHSPVSQPIKPPDISDKKLDTKRVVQAEKQTFWSLLKKWLSSPWSTSWASLKDSNNKK